MSKSKYAVPASDADITEVVKFRHVAAKGFLLDVGKKLAKICRYEEPEAEDLLEYLTLCYQRGHGDGIIDCAEKISAVFNSYLSDVADLDFVLGWLPKEKS